jgi:bifunctional DNA-binding transcriptional regulator/antitoxin component of YhaV-PrlF toxin-antitoxin module
MLPKAYRLRLGLEPGTKLDITPYGAGLALVPQTRSARIVRDQRGHLVAGSDTVLSDEELYAAIDAGRK